MPSLCDNVPDKIYTLTRTYAGYTSGNPGKGKFSFFSNGPINGNLAIAINMTSKCNEDQTLQLPGLAQFSVMLIQAPDAVKTALPFYSFSGGGLCETPNMWIGDNTKFITGGGGSITYGDFVSVANLPLVVGKEYLICAYFDDTSALKPLDAVNAGIADGIPGTLEVCHQTGIDSKIATIIISVIIIVGAIAIASAVIMVLMHNSYSYVKYSH